MTTVDETHNNFKRELEETKDEHDRQVDLEKQQIQSAYANKTIPERPGRGMSRFDIADPTSARQRQISPALPKSVQELVNVTHSDPLKALDEAFLRAFKISTYYPIDKFTYPTEVCESPEEYFATYVADENISDQAREKKIAIYVEDFNQKLRAGKPLPWGVNFPGRGCYINGWLIARKLGIDPSEVVHNEEAFLMVIENAVHEKLGHGFLSDYSTFGQLGNKLGLTLARIASQFGIAPADDAESQLRYRQQDLHFKASKFLEEGWATWIENYFQGNAEPADDTLHYLVTKICGALAELPSPDRDESLLAMQIIFGGSESSLNGLMRAIQTLSVIDKNYYDLMGDLIGQPLRYGLGEALCRQSEMNSGLECVPFVALIAANVNYDPARLSLSDLDVLLNGDARLNPNTRLAAISRIKIEHPGNLHELTDKINSELSLIIPPELKK